MYRKKGRGWTKHIDFMLLDVLCMQIAFIVSYIWRFGPGNPYTDNIFWINALLCVAIILSSFKSLKFEGNLYSCGDDCRLTDRLQKNGRGKKKIYV